MKRQLLFSFLSLLFVVSISEARDPFPPGAPIKVGNLFSLSGPFTVMGKPGKEGLDLAVDKINAMGGVEGHRIDVITYDDGSDETKCVLATKKLIQEDKVLAIVGVSASGLGLSILPTIEESKVPLLITSSTLKLVMPIRKYVFKPIVSEKTLCEDIFAMFKLRGIKQFAILHHTAGWGTSATEYTKTAAPAEGFEIVAVESYAPNDTDFTAQLVKIKRSGAKAILVWGTEPGCAIIAKQIHELGLGIPMTGAWTILTSKTIELAGKYYDGLVAPVNKPAVGELLPDTDVQKPAILEFIRGFRAKYGRAPGSFEGIAPDSVTILAHALKSAIPQMTGEIVHDRDVLRDRIEATNGLVGINGIFTFSRTDHEGIKRGTAQVLVEVRGGKLYPWKP